MDDRLIDRIVESVLYEGYLLYPYRRSLKNVKRWTFGTIFPEESPAAQAGTERSAVRARMLVSADAVVAVELRFLHVIERTEPASEAVCEAADEADEVGCSASSTAQGAGWPFVALAFTAGVLFRRRTNRR